MQYPVRNNSVDEQRQCGRTGGDQASLQPCLQTISHLVELLNGEQPLGLLCHLDLLLPLGDSEEVCLQEGAGVYHLGKPLGASGMGE